MRVFPFVVSQFLPMVFAVRVIKSSALEICQTNSSFTASLFDINFTPNNNSVLLSVVGESTAIGYVTFEVEAAAYGYTFLRETLNPCTMGLTSFCPMEVIPINFDAPYTIHSSSVIDRIPSIAYTVPDLDATVTVYIRSINDPTVNLACARSLLSNGKTVLQSGVGWAAALVAGIGLLTSSLISGVGHSNTASHIAVYASSLFNYFQAVAIIGLCAIPLPPIVQSWTQDFSWSMGIIKVGFLQTLATWYQRATGGRPSTILDTVAVKSVQVLKRSVGSTSTGEYTVKGIKRVAFRAGIESTNLFMTGLIFYSAFIIFTLFGVVAFNELCKLAIRSKWIESHRFANLRNDFRITLKGIIFRLLIIGYPQITILCLWEFTQIDSPAEVALAVIAFFGISGALAFAIFKVVRIARRSVQIHKTPAYMLYSDPSVLNRWGFLYIQYQASAYYYAIPTFAFILAKGLFVALGQGSGTVQAVALVMIEAAALISASVIRPWMDKTTNVINISICAINFVNALFILIFTSVFNGPDLLIGVVGVIFFIVNAVFASVLLFIVLIAVAYSIRRNPDTRYQPFADNRTSFIKSSTALWTELDALGVTARGDSEIEAGFKDSENPGRLENDDGKRQSSDVGHHQVDAVLAQDRFGETNISRGSLSVPFLSTNHNLEILHND